MAEINSKRIRRVRFELIFPEGKERMDAMLEGPRRTQTVTGVIPLDERESNPAQGAFSSTPSPVITGLFHFWRAS